MKLDLILSMRNMYISCKLNPLIKFTSSRKSTEFKDSAMEHLSNDHKTVPISARVVISYTMKRGIHPILSLTESQWKLKQQRDQNFAMEGKKPV